MYTYIAWGKFKCNVHMIHHTIVQSYTLYACHASLLPLAVYLVVAMSSLRMEAKSPFEIYTRACHAYLHINPLNETLFLKWTNESVTFIKY
jgi:hypothetical protein